MSAANGDDAADPNTIIAEQRERIRQLEQKLEEYTRTQTEAERNLLELRALIDEANSPIFGTDTQGRVTKYILFHSFAPPQSPPKSLACKHVAVVRSG
jgi:hypothetical protein